MSKQKYYAVRIGRVPGVYKTLEEYQEQVNGFSCAKSKVFKDEKSAEAYVKNCEYYAVRTGKRPGIYTTLKEVNKQIKGYSGYEMKKFSSFNDAQVYINAIDVKNKNQQNGSSKQKKERYYAVRIGRIPGIYTDLEEVIKQVKGYSNSEFKKFSDVNDAYSYIFTPVKIKDKKYIKNKTKKEKYYAVRKGLKPGIYKTLKTFNKHMKHFSGAEGRVFNTLKEAQEYMKGENFIINPFELLVPEAAVAYVDGSFSDSIKACSYGCIIFHMSSKIVMSERFYDKEMVSITNVAGELAGALASMQWCIENDIKELHLYYDFSGIKEYYDGNCKTRSSFTRKYKELCESYITTNGLNVIFHKVKSHSGDIYNNEVDRIAKKALVI